MHLLLGREGMRTRKELEALGNRILAEIRTELFLAVRVMGPALDALGYRMDLSTRSIGTDAEVIRYNPRYVTELFMGRPRRLLRCYMHMLLHCLFRHPFTRNRVEDAALYDLCADIAVEALLDSMGEEDLFELPSDFRESSFRRLKQEAEVLTAEKLYGYFREHLPEYEYRQQLEAEFRQDDHHFWDELNQDRQPPENQPLNRMQQREEDWKNRARSTKNQAEVLGKEAAGEQGSLSWLLSFTDENKTDYREFLRRFTTVREEVRIDPDGFDYGYYHLGLELYGDMPLIEENETRETVGIDQLVIAIDTSGSTKPHLVRRFLEETAAILSAGETFFHRVQIHLIECDNQVQKDLVLTDVSQLKDYAGSMVIHGGMGTDFRPVFAYVDGLLRQGRLTDLRGLIYFTDGYGTYPTEPVPYDTAFVFRKDQPYDDSGVPDWAIRLYAGD